MSQLNLEKLIAYMAQAIKRQWSNSGHGRLAARIRQIVTGDQRPETRNQQPEINNENQASGIQYPAASRQQPVSNSRQPAPGFTLLEVLIALAIMAIVLVSVYRLHSQTLSMTTANRFYTQAPLLAQSKMAQLEESSAGSISGESGDFGEKFPGYSWSVATEDVSSETLGEIASDLKRIDVTVTLNENEYVYSIRSYRLMRE